MNRISTTLLALAIAAGSLTTAGPALAKGDDDRVIRTGSCSGSADWKLKVKTDDNQLEVEGEVDSNVNGQTWRWRILHNGSVSAKGRATTTGPSGSFDVERKIVDAAGRDTVVFKARRVGSQETCRGEIVFG